MWNSQCDKYSSYEWYKCEICDFSTARKDIIENHTDVFITGVLTAIHASKVRKVYRAIWKSFIVATYVDWTLNNVLEESLDKTTMSFGPIPETVVTKI